jgi:hypothetical protein
MSFTKSELCDIYINEKFDRLQINYEEKHFKPVTVAHKFLKKIIAPLLNVIKVHLTRPEYMNNSIRYRRRHQHSGWER